MTKSFEVFFEEVRDEEQSRHDSSAEELKKHLKGHQTKKVSGAHFTHSMTNDTMVGVHKSLEAAGWKRHESNKGDAHSSMWHTKGKNTIRTYNHQPSRQKAGDKPHMQAANFGWYRKPKSVKEAQNK